MDERIQHALARDRTIDITIRGRKTGQLRRTEIWFHHIDGQVYITGTPGRRDWYANLLAHPEFTFHLKQSVNADLPTRAMPILDAARRRQIIASIYQKLGGYRDLEAWVEGVHWSSWNSSSSEGAPRQRWGRRAHGNTGTGNRADQAGLVAQSDHAGSPHA